MKISKDKKRKYFIFSIQNDEKLHRGVCFFPGKYRLFTDIVKDSANSSIAIKWFRSSSNNNEIIVNWRFYICLKNKVNFERKTLQANIFTIE